MAAEHKITPPFNTPLETGIRSVGILVAAYPRAFDLQRLVAFDYLVVHTGDIGGPSNPRPQFTLKSTDFLIRSPLAGGGRLLLIFFRQRTSDRCLFTF